MAKAKSKITLSPSRDIPFNLLVLSQSNVRKIKSGVSIPELAEDIARRTLLQSLNVRPQLDGEGQETGHFEVPAGGRRFRALELLVKQKRLAPDAAVPCVVRANDDAVSAVEDSYAENDWREPLHPLDQFRAMRDMVEQGQDAEAIAARFMVTPAVVRQRLRLAAVSPSLHAVYAEDGMTLDQLMAFAVSDDHARQEQVWELLAQSFIRSPTFIRQKLTENTVRVADKRLRLVGLDAYEKAGGTVMRDLFEDDDGGWLTDPPLLDRLVADLLKAEAERIGAEGWKWVAIGVDLPWDAGRGMRELDGTPEPMTDDEEAQHAALVAQAREIESEWQDAGADEIPQEVSDRLTAIDEAIALLIDRPMAYDPADKAVAGVFISVDVDGSLCVERGYVRPEDEPRLQADAEEPDHNPDCDGADCDADEGDGATFRDTGQNGARVLPIGSVGAEEDSEGGGDIVKPLPDRLVAELTAWRTLALQDALAVNPAIAFIAVLHAMVLDTFYISSRESCLQVNASKVTFSFSPTGLKDSPPARSIAERHTRWKARLPEAEAELWDALQRFDSEEHAGLFAHCTACSLNAQQEVVPKYDNGRISRHGVDRRVAHSHVVARAVGLDLVGAGWKPTVADYFAGVTKPRILADVTEAKGEHFAQMIDHLKKGDMAREAERLLNDAGWLPEVMRTPPAPDPVDPSWALDNVQGEDGDGETLPSFLQEEPAPQADDDGDFAADDVGEGGGEDDRENGGEAALAA